MTPGILHLLTGWLTSSAVLHILAAVFWFLALNAASGHGNLHGHPETEGLANVSAILCLAFAILAFTLQVIA